jgi:hypothetical protein
MTPKKLTKYFLLFATIITIIYDIVIINVGGVDATISRVILAWSMAYPILPLAVGIVVGHLWWAQKIEVIKETNKQQIEINCIGWWAIISDTGNIIAVFPHQSMAEQTAKALLYDSYNYTIQQITAKIPFDSVTIENALAKRCAEVEQTMAKSKID